MLRANEIDALRGAAEELTAPIVDYLIQDLAKRVAKAGQFTATAQYETWKLQELGLSQREIKKRLKKLLKVSNRELRKMLTQSAEAGYSDAMCNLGYCYEMGNGVEKNLAKAAEWYRKAADNGNEIAQSNLGIFYEYGKGVTKNYAEAVE